MQPTDFFSALLNRPALNVETVLKICGLNELEKCTIETTDAL